MAITTRRVTFRWPSATVITTNGEVLGDYDINPEKSYQAKK
jgi:hypothetical protein